MVQDQEVVEKHQAYQQVDQVTLSMIHHKVMMEALVHKVLEQVQVAVEVQVQLEQIHQVTMQELVV